MGDETATLKGADGFVMQMRPYPARAAAMQRAP